MVIGMKRVLTKERGSGLVEFGIVFMLLVTMMLGIVEFGLIMKDYQVLDHAAREGARSASIGSPVAKIRQDVRTAAGSLQLEDSYIQLFYAVPDEPDTWYPLVDSGDSNCAASGDYVRVFITYPHALVTGFFFAGSPSFDMKAEMIMRRE